MRKFTSKSFLLALPVLLGLILTNYIGDGAKLFDKDYEKDIAQIIIKGKNVTNIQNFDERLFQQYLIQQEKQFPGTIVIGSSRTMLINSVVAEDTSLVNNSVSGASLEDLISIYQLYKDEDKLPKKVIMGIDPWLFNINNDQKRWQSISGAYYRFHNLKNADTTNGALAKLKQLVSLAYFQSSFKTLPKVIIGSDHPIATTNKYNRKNTRLSDGSLIYGEQMRDVTEDEVEELVQSFINDKIYGLRDFNSISGKIWIEFRQMISDMKANGVEIEFFLAPYHPVVYNEIKAEYLMVLKTETIITKYAESNGIKVYGSFNPEKSGLNKQHFYDGMHCNEEGIARILKPQDGYIKMEQLMSVAYK